MTPTNFNILIVTLFTWPLKVRFSQSVINTKEFDCWNFSNYLFSNFNVECIFLFGYYHIWSFTNVQKKFAHLEAVINSYQFPVNCGMNIVNGTVRCKNCCTISKMNKTHVVWGSMNVIDIHKKKGLVPTPSFAEHLM